MFNYFTWITKIKKLSNYTTVTARNCDVMQPYLEEGVSHRLNTVKIVHLIYPLNCHVMVTIS